MQSSPCPPWSATRIAAAVRAGELDPRVVVEASLTAIHARNGQVDAFIQVCDDAARAEADVLSGRDDIADLPLAGVPVAIKDNIDVAGLPSRHGSRAFDASPVAHDHPTVARLRAAGAIVVGKTHVPELCCWGSSESFLGHPRNPWNLGRVTGGSSGGSAAAVAAGMVPVALGNDGMGSIRVPAAACGLFGIKPGLGVVPSELRGESWFEMAENGPLTTCVADARLLLAVLADDQTYAAAAEPTAPLRIAVSPKPPVVGTRVAPQWRRAVEEAAALLAQAGHTVATAHPPYKALDALTLGARWTAGLAEDAKDLDHSRLERRTRGHLRFGQVLRAAGFTAPRHREAWTARLQSFFTTFDVLLTPTLAQPVPAAGDWHQRAWLSTVYRDASYAPFAARFNLAGVPAASVPWGLDDHGLPLAVQLVAPRGQEATLLALAEQLEALHPWPHTAPAFPAPQLTEATAR